MKNNKDFDTNVCNKCGGRTALVTGTYFYHQDDEPYNNGVEEESLVEDGECWIGAFMCDKCGNIQDFWTE